MSIIQESSIQEIENIMSRAERYVDSYNYLTIGIFLGLLGGMWGNIIDRYFSHYGEIYILALGILTFSFLLYITRKFQKKFNPLVKEAKEKLESIRNAERGKS
jgi:hypothetical protein